MSFGRRRPPPERAAGPRRAVAGLALTLAAALSAGCSEPARAPAPPPGPAAGIGHDAVERAASSTLRRLALAPPELADLAEAAGAGRVPDALLPAFDAWLAALRSGDLDAAALSFHLEPERFDAVTRTWPVVLRVPALARALDAPAARLELVLADGGGAGGPPEFRIDAAVLARN